jgi:hypothetical protein
MLCPYFCLLLTLCGPCSAWSVNLQVGRSPEDSSACDVRVSAKEAQQTQHKITLYSLISSVIVINLM